MIYESISQAKKNHQKKLAVLIDPDQIKLGNMERLVILAAKAEVDYFFIGGSLLVNDKLDHCLVRLKEQCNIPLLLFPGNSFQLSYKADAILFLSLISGRNPELLIGNHVIAAPFLKLSPLEVISTGYMLIDGGIPTTVSYMSNTNPIPANKEDIAVCTALAGEMLGLKQIYLDAGSGAKTPISTNMIEAVSDAIQIPLIVGGGIRTPEKAFENAKAGADVTVIGNAFETNPELLMDIAAAIKAANL